MSEFIKKLQKKPKHERQRILNLAMLIIVILLIGIWVFSLKQNFFGENKKKISRNLRPFSFFKESFSKTYKNTADNISNFKNSINE